MTDRKPKLLIAESRGFSVDALTILRTKFDVHLADLSRQELVAEIGQYEYLWVRLRYLIDEQILQAAPNLKAVATNTTGLTHFDLNAVQKYGTSVISLRGETEFLREIRATAEHTVALCLALLRSIPAAHKHCIEGNWNRRLFEGSEIHRKTVGIIGYGRLGSIVAEYFSAFGAKVIVNSIGLASGTQIDFCDVVTQSQLLADADIVSLHADYTAENRMMIAAPQFSLMKPTSVFINTARGELVDEDALASVLKSGGIAGAALDVLANEHSEAFPSATLRAIANETNRLILTPHIGGNTCESLDKTERYLSQLLCEFADANHPNLPTRKISDE